MVHSPSLASTDYTAVISAIFSVKDAFEGDLYWINLADGKYHWSGLFLLKALNSGLGAADESLLNFVMHLPTSRHTGFAIGEEGLIKMCRSDFRHLFGRELRYSWYRISRMPFYSPVFVTSYQRPPIRSVSWENVFFAGNYRSFPSIASTGTAMRSGVDAAQSLCASAILGRRA